LNSLSANDQLIKQNMLPSALSHVQEIAARGDQLAVFLDYDGTLTPIVSRPDQAVLLNSTRAILRTLSATMPVAILSGRELQDVRKRVDIDGLVYAGSHGFDIAGPHGLRRQEAKEFLPALDFAEKEIREKLAGIPGALIERKCFSIAAHYRKVNERDFPKLERAVREVAARRQELRMIDGKKVYELLPNIDWDKGKAVLWLLENLGLECANPIYIGDDRTDEDAFRALERCGVGILVSEQPRPTAASYSLKDPAEVERFLRELALLL
jgi:trehalose 6-phosphate phosphatase